MVQRLLEWAHLKAKVPKCHSMAIQASTGKRVCPSLTISGDSIPPAEDGAFKFLGMPVRVHSSNDDARSSLQGSLQRMLTVIDETPLTSYASSSMGFAQGCHGPCLSQSHGWNENCSPWQLRPSNSGLVLQDIQTRPLFPAKRGGLALPSRLENTRSCRHQRWYSCSCHMTQESGGQQISVSRRRRRGRG